ncbi:hypothetical protein DV738_g2447, partial [Chaetothyriales sp. CBS 135597]
MKIDHRRSPLVLLLVAATIVSSQAAVADTRLPKQQIGEPADVAAAAVGTRSGGRVGTEHAPVDGKDGMPHEGPWVETAAERSRRKDANNDDVVEVETPSTDTAGLPQSNEGVMDDKNRKKPEDGTRGVEGGVSERKKQNRLENEGKKPEQPKEARPLPQSEKEKIQNHDQENGKKPLAVPDDLPAKPHDIPHPENPSSPKDKTIDREGSGSSSSSSPSTAKPDHEPAVISPIHSLLLSFAMIVVSEIGDKTFLVACLMAMRHDRLLVFSAAFSALIAMTVLSAILGHAVPSLIPKQYTNFLASCLFLVFGVRMLLEARKIAPDEGVTEEMHETFVMTFLGEWGDRSQVATIAMAAGQDYIWVTGGALAGHAICTGMAVLGGKAIAGRVSLRTVTLGGAVAFLFFAVLYLLEALY